MVTSIACAEPAYRNPLARNCTLVTAPLANGMGFVWQLVPLQEEISVVEVRPLRSIFVAIPSAGPRQLCPVRNPGAVSAIVILLLDRLPSSRTIFITAGPGAESLGITKSVCPQPAEAHSMPAGRATPRESVTCTEMRPSVKGARGPVCLASYAAIIGP